MPKEYRISAVVPLPEDEFEEAEAKVRLKPILENLHHDLTAITASATVDSGTVTPKPREAKTTSTTASAPEPPPPENAEGDAQPASRSSRKRGVANVSEENGKTT